jgi:hypothetical protein
VSNVMRVVAFLTGLVPISCHYTVTAPRLWTHNSSAAFNVWVFGWIFGIIFLLVCWAHTFTRSNP